MDRVGARATHRHRQRNLSPSNAADGGLVTEITPSLAVNWKGNRTTLVGDVSLPVVLYLPSGVASDRVFPSVNLLGDSRS